MNFEFDLTITMSLILSVIVIGFTWFRTRRHDVDERFMTGAKRMGDLDKRVQAVEQSIAVMPGKDDIHRLEMALSEIAGDIKAMRATTRATNDAMARIDRVVNRHEDHLLDGSKK
ncbi:MAG TPA: DUF2730 family protein [Rhizobiales bacterium]|nr:DUF2730 family protein [Hyphomicrobiales bacterium]